MEPTPQMTDDASLDPKILPAGLDALLVRFAATAQPEAMAAAQSMAAALDRQPPVGMVEMAPGLVSVLLRFDGRAVRDDLSRDLLAQARRIAAERPALPAPLRRWTIPAAFGGDHGPQLADIANRIGQSEQGAVDQLCQTELRVLAIGFAPGQPYIGLLPEAWNLPRMSDLNPQVPAGALVSAVRQLVMFTAASTTGWRHIAQTGFRCFDPTRETPLPLRPGDAIRYAPVAGSEIDGLMGADDGLGGARLEVLA